MKILLLRCFHLLMAIIVLTTSMGFGLVEHSCQMRGKRISSVLATDPCLGCVPEQQIAQAQQNPTVKRTDCCKDESRYEHLNVGASLSQVVAKFLKAISEAILASVATVIGWLADLLLPNTSSDVALLANPPPPRAGRLLLIFIRQFLI